MAVCIISKLTYLPRIREYLKKIKHLVCVFSHSLVSDSLQPQTVAALSSSGPWVPDKNSRVGCHHFLLQDLPGPD